ncbi:MULTISPECIES: hypothetical protein [unclassified Microcoleus]|uniref:hypothetical protein n=1 Tax=unclassified Microcoleus TaxID=2642155 RepID=UPI001D501FA9|nr:MULTISPECIES: hypothetical protein [unclassified Microcoleus]MCC3473981.1 hypothetical protein [Microcoleus sp. PH2017_13_LAR_U_A]MCC3486063.1 hypothetical protein [Microcoleus sp. PH2017_14_LAR_D_A]MCC3598595.1 hypothetical protein [Microcoleus sp. PH2017_26_ELK_O_A]MCC3623923.1 hypothetical protein [Microcoleus sp. PH2017_36_ELK_O_B]
MPALNKYNKRDPVTVPLGPGLLYAFETNVDTEERASLGHTAITAAYPPGSFIGANSPKPRRARRLTATGWNSSFCAETPAVITALKAAGWQVGLPPKKRAIIPLTLVSARVVTVFVQIAGIKYAWNMPKETFNKITQATLTLLGVEIATNADKDTLVWGSTIPKPARAQFILTTGGGGANTPIDGQDTLTTFVTPSIEDSLPAGWKIIKPKIIFQ